MHTKSKGTLGELAVMKALMEQGIPVFTEYGDNCRIDLIAIIDKKPIRIQVKAVVTKRNVAELYVVKSGPGYKYKYSIEDLDVFAIYVIDKDDILYISAKEALEREVSVSFRYSPVKNGQTKKVRMAKDYKSFPSIA